MMTNNRPKNRQDSPQARLVVQILNDKIPNVPQSAAGLYEIDLLDYFDDLLRFRARDKRYNSFCRPEAPAQDIDEGTNNNYNYNYTATQSFNNSTLPPPPRSSFRDLDIADADASIVEITNLKENSVRDRLSLVGGVVGGRSRGSVPVDLRSLTNDSSTDSSPGTLVREYDAKPFLDLPKTRRNSRKVKGRLPPFPGNAYGSVQSKAGNAGGRSSSFGRELASTSEGVLGDDVEVLANRSTNQGLGKLQHDLDPSSAYISPDGRTAYPSRASYILQTLTAEEAKYVIALELGYKVFQCGLLPQHLLELVAVDELSSLHAAEFRSSASGGRKPALGKSTFSRMRIKDILHPEARGGGAGAMGGSIMSGTNNLEGTHNSLYHGEEQARVDRMLGSHQLYQAGLRKNGPGTGRGPVEGVHRMPAALHRTSMTRSQHHQSPPSNPPGRTLASSGGSLHKTLEFSDFAGNISRFSELLEYARATRWNAIGKMGLPRAGILESTDDAYAALFSEGVRAELVDRPARGETATASPHRSQLLVYVGPSEFDWTKQQGGFVQHGGGAQHHHVGSVRDFTGDVRNHKTWRFELGDEESTRYSLRMLEFLSRHGSSGGRLEGGSGPICGKTLMREEERDEVVFSDDEESGDEEVTRNPTSGQVEVSTMTYLGALKREKAARNGPAKRKNRGNKAGKIVTRPVTALEVVCFVGASKYHLPAEKNSNAATKQLLSPSGVRSLHHARELVHAMSSHELNATDRKGNSLMLRAYQQLYHFPKRFEVVAQAVLEQCPRFQLLHGCDSEEGKTLLHICVQQRWGEAVVRLLSGRPGNDKWRMETNYVSRRAANFFTNLNFLNSTSHATQIPRPDAHDRKGNSCLFDAVDANDGRMLALLLKFCLESPEKMHGWRTIATSKPVEVVGDVHRGDLREDQSSEVSSVDVAGNPDRHFHLRKLPAGREYVGEASVYNKEKGGSRSYGEQQQIEFPLLEHASRGGHSVLMHAIYKRREGVVLKILTELCLLIKRCSINDWNPNSARGNSSNSLVSGKEHSRYSPEYIPLASPAFGGGDPVYGRIPPVGGPETYNGEGGSVKWPQAGVGGKYFGGNNYGNKRGAEVLHMAPPVGGQQPGIGRTATGGGFSQQHAPFVSQQHSHQAGDHQPTNSDPRVTEDFCELIIHPQNTDPAVYRKLLFDLVNFRDQDGRTLLSAACSMGLVRVVEVLLGELDEARCDTRNNVGGMPVSTKIAPTSTTTTRSTLTSLLRPCGFLFTDDNVNAVDLFGKNALHYAIARREYEICNLLFFSRRFRAYNDPEIARFFAERHHRDIVPLIPRLLANLEKRWHIQNEAASKGRTRNIGGAALEVAGSTGDAVGRFAQQDFFRREDGRGSRRRDPGDFEESGREQETTTSSAAGDLFPQPHPEKNSSSRIPEVLDPEPARPYDEIVAEDSDAYFEELRRPARSPMTKRERERAAAMKKGGGVGGKRRPEPLESYVADEEIEQFVRSFSDHFGVGNVDDMDIPISPPISPIAQMDTERALQAGAGNRGNKLPKGGSNAAANVKKKTARQKRGVTSADNSYRAYEQIPAVRAVPAQDEILVENHPDADELAFEEEEAGDRFDEQQWVLPPPDLAELKDLPGNNSSSPSLTMSPAVTHATSRRSGAGGTGADHSANVTTSSSSLPVSFTETTSHSTRNGFITQNSTNAFAEVITQEQAEVLIQEEAEGTTMKQQNTNNAGVGRARNLVISTSDRPSPLTGEEQTSPLRNRSDSVEFGKDLSQKWSDRLNSSPSRNITEKYRDFKISRPADQDLSDLRGAGAAGSKSRGMTAAEAYNYAHGSGSFAVAEGQHRREVCCPSENKTAHLLLLDDEEDDYANDRESFARATRHPPKRNSKTSNCRDNCSAGRDVLVRRHHRRRAGAGSGQNGDKNRQLLTYAKTALSPLPQSPDAANHLPGFPPAAFLTSPCKRGGARDCMPGGWHEGMHCAEDTLFSETESGCNGLRNEGAPASGIEPLFFCEGTHESGDFQEQQKRPEDSRVTRNLHDITYIEGSHRANQSLPLESPMARLQRYSDNYHPNHDPYGPPPFPSPDMPLYNSNRNYYIDSMRLNHATDEVVQNVQKERKKLLGDKFAHHGWTPHHGHFRKAHKSLDVKIARSVEDYDEVYRIDHAGDVVEKKSYFNTRSREGELELRQGDTDTRGEEPLISGYSYYDEVLDLDMQLHSGEVRAGRAGRRKEKINSEVENEREEKHHLVIADDPGLNFDALKTNEEFIPDDQRLPDMLRGGSLRKLVGGGGGASASARLKTKPAAAREDPDDNELAPPAKTSGADAVVGYDERVTFGSTFNKSHSSTSRIEETRGTKNDTTTTSSTSLAQHDEPPPQHINVFHASVAGYQYLGKKDGREYYLSAVNDGWDYILAASTKPTDCDAYGNRLTNATEIAKSVRYQPPPSSRRTPGAPSADRTEKTYLLKAHLQSAGYEGRRYLAKVREEETAPPQHPTRNRKPTHAPSTRSMHAPGGDPGVEDPDALIRSQAGGEGPSVGVAVRNSLMIRGGGGGGELRAGGAVKTRIQLSPQDDIKQLLAENQQHIDRCFDILQHPERYVTMPTEEEIAEAKAKQLRAKQEMAVGKDPFARPSPRRRRNGKGKSEGLFGEGRGEEEEQENAFYLSDGDQHQEVSKTRGPKSLLMNDLSVEDPMLEGILFSGSNMGTSDVMQKSRHTKIAANVKYWQYYEPPISASLHFEKHPETGRPVPILPFSKRPDRIRKKDSHSVLSKDGVDHVQADSCTHVVSSGEVDHDGLRRAMLGSSGAGAERGAAARDEYEPERVGSMLASNTSPSYDFWNMHRYALKHSATMEDVHAVEQRLRKKQETVNLKKEREMWDARLQEAVQKRNAKLSETRDLVVGAKDGAKGETSFGVVPSGTNPDVVTMGGSSAFDIRAEQPEKHRLTENNLQKTFGEDKSTARAQKDLASEAAGAKQTEITTLARNMAKLQHRIGKASPYFKEDVTSPKGLTNKSLSAVSAAKLARAATLRDLQEKAAPEEVKPVPVRHKATLVLAGKVLSSGQPLLVMK